MKRISILTAFTIALFAANSFAQTTTKKTTKSSKTTTTTTSSAKPSAVALEEGKQLLSKNDCLSCHKVDVKIVGPAYKDVAKKYPATAANYDLLSKKVIAGGSGVWGEVPMSAHPSLAPADAKKMVQYILSLK